MTKSKNTKKALLASIISMLMCFIMLIGSTFAWFTDNASTSVNKIQAGTLDIVLQMKDGDEWVDAENQTLDFIKADGSTEILWEPGVTYNIPVIRLVNNGTLWLKYQIVISGINGDAKLNEAIEWTINDIDMDTFDLQGSLAPNGGESAELVISGHMKEEAGNEYQGLSIEGIAITVVATQKDAEYDSNDNQYDAGAQYKYEGNLENYVEVDTTTNTATIKDAIGLMAFAEKFGTDATKNITNVVIAEDIDLSGYDWKPINAWDPENSKVLTIDGQNHTISNMTATGGSKIGFIGSNARDIEIKDLTFDNAKVTTSGSMAAVVIGYQYGDVVLNNVNVTNSEIKTTAETGIRIGALVGQSFLHDGATLRIEGCDVQNTTVSGYHNVAGMVGSLMNYSTLTDKWSIKNSSVSDCTLTVTSASASNESYISTFACEGGNYGEANKYLNADTNVFVTSDTGNKTEKNTYNLAQ